MWMNGKNSIRLSVLHYPRLEVYLVQPIYKQLGTSQNPIIGFKKNGITDSNINVFSDIDFLSSQVTGQKN